jgi:hypothetical protein
MIFFTGNSLYERVFPVIPYEPEILHPPYILEKGLNSRWKKQEEGFKN